jgi:hypothetical protein
MRDLPHRISTTRFVRATSWLARLVARGRNDLYGNEEEEGRRAHLGWIWRRRREEETLRRRMGWDGMESRSRRRKRW